ncbi:MAG TPA: AAA family ATPase, partial [Polyangiales bacterium]
ERGAARVVVVEGSSGLGKTTLVEHFLSELRAQHRAIVLAGRCYVNEDVTYQAVDGSIDALSHYLRALPEAHIAGLLPRDVRSLARLFPVLNRIERIALAPPVRSLEDKIGLRERAASALRELLARLSDRLPPVLFIDDVQWDDADSAWLLSTLLAVPDPPALMLILACRSEEQPKSLLLSELRLNPLTERLIQAVKLRALSTEETRALVMRSLPSAQRDPQLSLRVAEESDGHPMFAIELAHFAQQRATDSPYVGQVSLDDALRSRAQRVSPGALRLLEMVCVAGSPLASSAALAAADSEPDARRELLLDKLITAAGAQGEETLSACHDRVREAIVADLPPERLRALHARLAQALLGDEPRFERVVEHYLAAGERGEAARYALRAADQANEGLAFHRVPDLLLLATEDVLPADRGPLYLRLGEAYALLGRKAEAARAYAQAASLESDPEQRWELESLAMWQALDAGDYARGFGLLQRLEKQIGGRGVRPSFLRLLEAAVRWPSWWLFGPPRLAPTPSTDAAASKRLRLCYRAFLGMLGGRTLLSSYYAIWALHGSARLGDRSMYASMLAMFMVSKSVMRGRASSHDQRLLTQAAELAATSPDEVVRLLVATCQTCYTFSIGQYERASRDFWALTETEIPPTPFGKFLHSIFMSLAAPLLFVSGHIARANQFAAGAIARVHEGGDAYTESTLRTLMAFRLLADDDDELALAEWSAARERFPTHEVLRWVPCVVPALYAGNLARAEEVLRLARRYLFHWEIYLDTGRAQFLWWWGAVASARLAAGERRRWLSLRLRLARMLLWVRTPPSAAPARHSLAAAQAFVRGDRARGVARLVSAQAAFEAVGSRMFAACASHVLASLHPDPAMRASHAARAQAVFELEKIKRPEKWVQALLPGVPSA